MIPAFNAEKRIGPVVKGARLQGFDVIVVDDGSSDRTAEVAAEAGAVVISLLSNRGKGTALRAGFRHALKERYDGIITMDGDGQHDPSELRYIVQTGRKQHAGLVLGNRTVDISRMPLLRRVTNRIMSRIISHIAGQIIPDSQCGLRFIRREVLEDIKLRTTHFELETEILLASAARKWKIVSVPVRAIYEKHQQSHISPIRDTIRFGAVILQALFRR